MINGVLQAVKVIGVPRRGFEGKLEQSGRHGSWEDTQFEQKQKVYPHWEDCVGKGTGETDLEMTSLVEETGPRKEGSSVLHIGRK